MTTAFLSVSASSHQTPLSQNPCIISNSWFHGSVTKVKYPYKPPILLSSPSPSSVSVVEDEPSPPPSDAVPLQSDSATEETDKVPFRGCKACGREELERGCNGEGQIQGGIATVPGFGWWPIKAYRPCPGFVASGGRYRRRGQSMDEVAFGRGKRKTPVSPGGSDDNPSKNRGGRKFKK